MQINDTNLLYMTQSNFDTFSTYATLITGKVRGRHTPASLTVPNYPAPRPVSNSTLSHDISYSVMNMFYFFPVVFA